VIDRREVLKFFPLTPLAFRVGKDEKIVEARPSVAQASSAMRTIFCFRLSVHLSQDRVESIRTSVREMLDRSGFSDALSFVLPVGIELDVFCVPKE
jgi:hypothetical protein